MRGSGFVLRCDGFVLAPSSLFATPNGENPDKQTVRVILLPGAPNEKVVPGRRPRFVTDQAGYAVLKLDGMHGPALRTLLSTAVPVSAPLEVVWREWDKATGKPGLLQRRSAKLGSEVDTNGRGQFERPIAGVPLGAVVVGPEGMAVGFVTSLAVDGQALEFTSFDVLNSITNCVTPVPTTDEAFAALQKRRDPTDESAKTVKVAGGPVALPRAVLAEQRDMEASSAACVAPFEIDKYEVTNRQYLQFWRSLPEAVQNEPKLRAAYYPASWSETDQPFPASIENFPVIGVPLAGAQAYARWQGKRLPTPYEWYLAAFGPAGEGKPPAWTQEYLADRKSVWQRVREKHVAYANDHLDLLTRDYLGPNTPQAGQTPISTELPWIVNGEAAFLASQFSRRTVEAETESLSTKWRQLHQVVPFGARPFDQSPFGARDMALNAAEMVVSSPMPPAKGALRYMEVNWLIQSPARRDPWTPLLGSDFQPALDNKETALNPRLRRSLNRLVSLSLDASTQSGYLVTELIKLTAHLYDEVGMLWPLSGWEVRMGSATEERAGVKTSVLNDVAATVATGAKHIGFSHAGYGAWRGMPRTYRREIGLPMPLVVEDREMPAPMVGAPPPPYKVEMRFLLPVGFRCVR